VSGIRLAVPEFIICDGLILRDTFAHVMAPYLLAFSEPRTPSSPHPGPWKAAKGGIGFDVHFEIALAKDIRPTNLDRLNTIWWVVALLRLKTGAPLRIPVISDSAFATIPHLTHEPTLWTIEVPPRQFATSDDYPKEITFEHLQWVQNVFIPGARLLDQSAFNRALQTFDSAIWAHSPSSAVLMIWAALEALFRPGRRDITKILSASIAAYLQPPDGTRDRIFQKIVTLYGARGDAVHDAQSPENRQLIDSFALARRVFNKCVAEGECPSSDTLFRAWKERS
jgi:hypothetical protein